MLTLSEIENISFREVSRFSFIKGYVCADVDNFVDEVTETVKSLAGGTPGTGHDQFLTGIIVQFDLTFSLKAWTVVSISWVSSL